MDITHFLKDHQVEKISPKSPKSLHKKGLLRKKDLIVTTNLKKKFNRINQHLYAKLKYIDTDTRTRSKEIVNLLICKLIDEMHKSSEDILDFCIRNNENEEELAERIKLFFNNNVKEKFKEIIGENEQINLNKELIYLIVEELQFISLLKSSSDILSDAFEIFVSKILKDEGGQFFTPPNVTKFIVNYLNPEIDSKILDPACGHGGFLLESKSFIWSKIEDQYKGDNEKIAQKKNKIIPNLFGIDKDLFLAKMCKLYLGILCGGLSNIFCEDSLDLNYHSEAKELIKNNIFDYIFTNPPFGSKIPIDRKEILKNYDFGHVWKNLGDNRWVKQKQLVKRQPPQVLFIERCVQLLKVGGKLGIVLPEGIFGNPTDGYIWEFLQNNGIILGVVSLDQNTFQPFTCNKTSILFFQKLDKIPRDYNIDFAIVDNVGHDKDGKVLYNLNKDGSKKLDIRGDFIVNDDLQNLPEQLRKNEDFDYLKEQKTFKLAFSKIKNKIFIPIYYTGVEKTLKILKKNEKFTLYKIKDLVKNKIIYSNNGGYIPRGAEIGSHVYGLGDIPFIRTSEFFNWEIKLDSHKKTSEEVYLQYKDKQNIQVGDILLVKDGGPNLIGSIAYISELDTKIIIQSHIYQIKTIQNDQRIDPFLLLYLLNLDIVQKQIKAITFIQGTIATIGNRIMDVILPIPSHLEMRKKISSIIKSIIDKKIAIRKKSGNLSIDLILNENL